MARINCSGIMKIADYFCKPGARFQHHQWPVKLLYYAPPQFIGYVVLNLAIYAFYCTYYLRLTQDKLFSLEEVYEGLDVLLMNSYPFIMFLLVTDTWRKLVKADCFRDLSKDKLALFQVTLSCTSFWIVIATEAVLFGSNVGLSLMVGLTYPEVLGLGVISIGLNAVFYIIWYSILIIMFLGISEQFVAKVKAEETKANRKAIEIDLAEALLKEYVHLQESKSFCVLVIFGISQVFWIFLGYNGFKAFNAGENSSALWPMGPVFYGCLILNNVIIMIHLVSVVEDAETAVKVNLVHILEERMKLCGSLRETLETSILIRRCERAPPFSGCGFFVLRKSTATTILSVTLTYAVILTQM